MPSDSAAPPDIFSPAQLGPVALRNRVIKSATFEGYAPHALVTDKLIDYHLAVAEGGVGMTTVAYLAVSPDGRTHREQIYWRPEALPGLAKLTAAIHDTGAKVSAQIGHAGPVANAKSNHAPSYAPTRGFNPAGLTFNRKATAADIARIVGQHAQAAAYAREVGFDAIEVHLGHNYLASAFMSPRMNHRRDEFGGTIAKRAEFARRILAAVRERVGNDIAVLAKLNMVDGYRGGAHLNTSLPTAQLLEADGHLDALVLTGGSSLMNPMYLFRGGAPVKEFAATWPQPQRLGIRLVGKWFLKEYPWEPLYFLPYARQFRATLKMPLVLLGGVVDRAGMDTAMSEGFPFVAMARALLREPDLLNRIQADAAPHSAGAAHSPATAPQAPTTTRSLCIHCNRCMPTIYSGTRCPIIAGS